MFRSLARAAAPILLLLASCATIPDRGRAPIRPAEMMRHIEVLASDAFEGRAPATEGEVRTIAYIAQQFAARGLEPGAADGSWYQPVALVARRAGAHRVRWSSNGRALPFDEARIALLGRDETHRVDDAPVVFVGHGAADPEAGVDQLAGADLRGAVALILVEAPDVPGFPSYEERLRRVAEAGAVAVIGIIGDQIPWPAIVEAGAAERHGLQSPLGPDVSGVMPAAALAPLIQASGAELMALLNERGGRSFRAVPLNLRVSIELETHVRHYSSNNVVGRIRGSGGGRESLLLLGHWDHVGLCRPEGAEDRICNGAVDNASGIAMLIEIAGRLAAGERPERDILFLATTAEEIGLLGAEYFAAHPTVPIDSIVAAINMDTVAIHGAGEPVAVIGRGIPELDSAIAATATALGRTMDTTFAADAFIRRQDGWALARAGVPAVMVGGSFANMALLEAFLGGDYHGPDDETGPDVPLDGAAEDANFLVALARRLADPALYSAPARPRAAR